LKKHRQKMFSGLPPPEAQIKSASKKIRENYQDPKYREQMRRTHRDPQLNRRRSEAQKKSWESRKRKRNEIDDKLEAFYHSSDWRRTTKQIQERDGHSCQACGRHKSEVRRQSAHHMYPLRDWMEDGHAPEDYPHEWLRTLCKNCHPSTDAQTSIFKWPREPESL
jgi:hypothetical protein